MKHILDRSGLDVLATFARTHILLGFDYDGTLAPIVDDPEAAFMRPSTRELLRAVARRYPVIIVSGRAQSDVLRRLRGVQVAAVIGNHGIEPWRAFHLFIEQVRSWLDVLASSLSEIDGVVVEDKIYSLAIHYRHAADRVRARDLVMQSLMQFGDARLVPGKEVINVLPAGAPHKGLAVRRQMVTSGCEGVVYVGDDTTDEDVFALRDDTRVLGIRVEEDVRSAASFYLRDQAEIEALLEEFLAARVPAPSPGAVD